MITRKNLSPASWDPGIAMPGYPLEWGENLPCNRDCRANTVLSLNFASEQNESPEGQYFSFYITHKGLSDHKAS